MNNEYPYAQKGLFENPTRYQMTPFIGPEFFRAWSRDRREALQRMAQNPGLPHPAPSGPTAERLKDIGANLGDGERRAALSALIRNFEAKGRLFLDYNPGFTSKGRQDYADISLYLALAKILLTIWDKQRDFVSLNSFIKCLDILCAYQDQLASGEPEQAAALIVRENEIVKNLSVELNVSEFPAEPL